MSSTTACPRSPEVRDWVIRAATVEDREAIYAARHEIYAREIGQHQVNVEGSLRDALDAYNVYLVATFGGEMAGFVSITPPGRGRYSVEKYIALDKLPFPADDRLYEVRLLTVLPRRRRTFLALALMWAAFRWVESRGGTRIVAIGREDVLDMYRRVGLQMVGPKFPAGAVVYCLMQGTTQDVHDHLGSIDGMLRRIEAEVQWGLGVAYWTPAPCYHGGEFFRAIGEGFDHLERHRQVINADVLDAWFPPAPGAVESLTRDISWLVRTSPPVDCKGLIQAVAAARGVPTSSILPGAGSSDLIFRVLRHWLTRGSRVLLLNPTYGEYEHLLESVVECQVQRWELQRDRSYRWAATELAGRLNGGVDLVVLVNPNSPTGQHVGRQDLETALESLPPTTRIWIDETYVDYAGDGESLEAFAAASANVFVCKSMSKVYGLSGLRVGYLCGPPHQLEGLRTITPPWVVGLPAQLAAVRALQDPDYYSRRWRETRALRESLAQALSSLGWDVVPGSANFLLCHLPAGAAPASTVVERCREHGLWLRDVSDPRCGLGSGALRLTVKDAATNRRILEILRTVIG